MCFELVHNRGCEDRDTVSHNRRTADHCRTIEINSCSEEELKLHVDLPDVYLPVENDPPDGL